MVINNSKSKVMLFNRSRKFDFEPEIYLSENKIIETLEEMRLLGVVISNDMKWHRHVKHISKTANSKLWILRRLKKLGCGQSILLDIYNKQIRSILEYAVSSMISPSPTQSQISLSISNSAIKFPLFFLN